MLNPDGRLWVDRLGAGIADTGVSMSASDGERIIRLVAHHVGAEVHSGAPRVSAELPDSGERFEGLLPPVVAAPSFAIRKPAVAVFTLADYVAAGILTPWHADVLAGAVACRKNILAAGGTSTGKTTLTNALLAEVAKTADRVVLIEDTRELQCAAPNLVSLRTKDGVASLSDLVRSALRLRPDRIPIGEVRGAEALDLLKAWGTGHPGGVGTIHAGTALGVLRRIEQLIQESVVTVPRALIAETIDVIAVLVRDGTGRRLPETPMHLDALLADEPLTGGLEPRLGGAHLRTLTIVGFPSSTFPELLDELNAQAFAYRWSTRAIMLDKTDATKLLGKIRRQWFAKRKSVAAILKEVMTNEASVLLDNDASNKAADADAALQERGADHVGQAYVTATVTVWDEDAALAAEKLRLVEKVIQGRDFTCVIEGMNAVEAWLGSFPGHVYANVRTPPDFYSQSCPHDPPLSRVGRAGTG